MYFSLGMNKYRSGRIVFSEVTKIARVSGELYKAKR